MNTSTITIVGVGLIGGSLGLAIKSRKMAERVLGVDVDQKNLRHAEEIGAIDDGSQELAAAVSRSQFVVVAAPMHCLAEQVSAVARVADRGAVITDTGSCKKRLVDVAERSAPDGVHFVGSHPLAGSEKTGPQFASAALFENRVTVITPTDNTNAEALAVVRSFWRNLGSKIYEMRPEEHDQIVAQTSHAPHLLASVLAGVLSDDCLPFAATGFRSTTRIAAGNPKLWTAIFEQNRQAVLEALAPIETRLAEFRAALEKGDWESVEKLLTHAKKVRDALGN